MKLYIKSLFLIALSVVGTSHLSAQYFGRNKPTYENFEFTVQQSPNFELYYYINNPEFIRSFTAEMEEWYHLHQNVLHDTINERNPFILYANHADFQQTNAIGGTIGTGTGGVTEAFKNRVILPVAMSNQQTHHVTGHELVHAFQYNMVINGDSTNLRNLANLPLWMVEGLAEYLSIGSVDAHTAMWMRDAVLHDDVPSLQDLSSGRYFPYRYGQAFWAFITGLKGDDVIKPLFTETAKYGLDIAATRVLGFGEKNLSELWQQAIKAQYKDYIKEGDKERFTGREIINNKNSGRMNIAPEVSPNGRYVIFLSEKSLFSTDLFLADARTGEIIRKVASSARGGHIDDFNYIESSGTWSPRSDKFAFVAVSKGRNILIIKETESGKTLSEVAIPGVEAFQNPVWSPNGDDIVVSGLVNGHVDLYNYNLKTGKVKQLTNDKYSEMHAAWSADGDKLVYSTDELSIKLGRRPNGKWHFNLAEMDMASGTVNHIDIFPGADNLNPEVTAAGDIVFLSNRDGFRNIYRYEPSTGNVYQMTDLITGVSGITQFAPAISIDRKRNRLVYTYFSQKGYKIFQSQIEDMDTTLVDPTVVDMAAAQLPRVNKRAPLVVDEQLENAAINATIADEDIQIVPYKSKFKLDYVAGTAGVGVGTSNTFGTTSGMAGGVQMLFGDILGDNQIVTSLSLNGEITDFGGAVAYINRKNKYNWGVQLSHIPYRNFSGSEFEVLDTLLDNNNNPLGLVDRYSYFITRIFEDQLSVFAQLPFSSTLRLEGGASYSLYSNRTDRYDNFYQPNSFFLVGQDREKVESAPGFNLGKINAAFVGDNANFGLTSPLQGQRFRLGVEQFLGEFKFLAATADYRRYVRLAPITLAVRGLHYGRYGQDGERLFPLYVGSPWYIRGLNSQQARDALIASGKDLTDFTGSKLGVANFEVRIPFTGPKQLALIGSKFLFSDLNFFIDGGIAFDDFGQLSGPITRTTVDGVEVIDRDQATPIFTTGVSLRVNLFGAMVLEPFFAKPLIKGSETVFGLNFLPGW